MVQGHNWRQRLRVWLSTFRWNWVFYAFTALAILLAIYTLVTFALQDFQVGQTLRLSIVWAILGMGWATSGIVGNILTIRATRSIGSVPKRDFLRPNLTPMDSVVDRKSETIALVDAVKIHQVTNVHGRKGSGKSHFLSFVADMANGHRDMDESHAALKGLKRYSVVYIDLSEALGFDDAVTQIFRSSFPDQPASWMQFTKIVDAAFKANPVILIVDNVNAPGIWGPLGQALYRYLSRRPADRIVLGSIQPVKFYNLSVQSMLFGSLDSKAISELAAANGITLSTEDVNHVQARSDGLPLFLRLLFAHWDNAEGAPSGTAEGIRHLLGDAIVPRLSEASVDLLMSIALLSVVGAEVDPNDLRGVPVDASREHLDELRDFSLIVWRQRKGRSMVKLHDLVRDAVIEVCTDRLAPIAQALAINAFRGGARSEAAIYWLYAAPNGFDDPDTVELIEDVVLHATNAKEYPLLTTLALLSESRMDVKRAALGNMVLHNALLLARNSALAGAGDYVAAIHDLEAGATPIFRKVGAEEPLTPIEFELAFLHADLTHLQNRYREALDTFSVLRAATETSPLSARKPKAEWMLGHVLRHQGRDLDSALYHFAMAHGFAEEIGDLPTVVAATTGRVTIEVLRRKAGADTCADLEKLETRLGAAHNGRNFLPKVWKSQAQLAFLHGDIIEAQHLIDKAIKKSLENNDRLMFNYHFERAEFTRLDGEYMACVEDYERVLEYGRENGDRNLIANALLGIVEAEVSYGKHLHHRSKADIRASVLQARAIAVEADIQFTVLQAEQTLSRLEGDTIEPARLFLF